MRGKIESEKLEEVENVFLFKINNEFKTDPIYILNMFLYLTVDVPQSTLFQRKKKQSVSREVIIFKFISFYLSHFFIK